jgi:hypothetical protein
MNGNSVASMGAYATPERVDLCEATRVAAIADRLDSPILPPDDPAASGYQGAMTGRLIGTYRWPPCCSGWSSRWLWPGPTRCKRVIMDLRWQ